MNIEERKVRRDMINRRIDAARQESLERRRAMLAGEIPDPNHNDTPCPLCGYWRHRENDEVCRRNQAVAGTPSAKGKA
jgi:rubrerythrin